MGVDARPQSTGAEKDRCCRLLASFDHPLWQCTCAREAHWRPLSGMVLHVVRVCGVWRGSSGALGALSLSMEEGRSTFSGMIGI